MRGLAGWALVPTLRDDSFTCLYRGGGGFAVIPGTICAGGAAVAYPGGWALGCGGGHHQEQGGAKEYSQHGASFE